MIATPPVVAPPRVTLVVLTHNRIAELARTLAASLRLPERPPIIVVDNGSTDGTAAWVRRHCPGVGLVRLPDNIGAAARNAGALHARTPYVAFCDDDVHWTPGSLARAELLLDCYPRVAVLSARVLVGAGPREDEACRAMAASPLPSLGLPGHALLGLRASASVFRRRAFLDAGGYEPRFFIGGEETLLALDLAALGWSMVYTPGLVAHHFPSPQRNAPARRRALARNALWTAWMRQPLGSCLRSSGRIVRDSLRDRAALRGVLEALGGLPWALSHRRPLPPLVARMLGSLAPR